MTANLELAKGVLLLEGWSCCGVRGRPLEVGDLPDLAALGRDDPTFAWERERQGDEYYAGLMQFRLGHYWRYGFGVHGVWQGTSMVGQVGLQVLSEEGDQVEFVVFLGQEYKSRGLGGCLTRYLVERCLQAGMTELFGVVRIDNPEGLGLMLKMGAQALERVTHFGQEAQVFRISLRGGAPCPPVS